MSISHWESSLHSSRSISPVVRPSSRQSNGCNSNSNENYDSPFVSNLEFLKTEDPEFELTDTIEWGPDDASPIEELAAKPKPDKSDDPCGCSRPDDPTIMACNGLHCVLYACQEECRSNCEAGEQCGNKRIQRRQWKRLEVFDAGKKGKGLRVLEDVKQGDLVTEYVGRAVNKLYLPHLFRRYANERKLYIMALTSDVYLDARIKGGVARYINHSCQPNCQVERWKVRGILRAAVIARKDIPAGTELSFDYQWERKRGRAPTKCHCGDPVCRGTLEVPRSMEERALERKLSQHWKKPLISRAGKEIVNRCIKLFSKETQEYYPADVTQYDDKTGKHLLMYRHDLDEVWEDLKNEDWMVLDEEAEQFIIRKKISGNGAAFSVGRSLLGAAINLSPGMMLQGQQQQAVGMNYVYTYTHIKDALFNKHLVERCQRSCHVTITPQQFQKQDQRADDENVGDNGEAEERNNLLESSPDGVVWKLIIVGSDIIKARSILEKNVAFLMTKETSGSSLPPAGATNASFNGVAAAAEFSQTAVADENSTEVILPRGIVDALKRRLPMLREKSRGVRIEFVPSESKSKRFGKLHVSGTLVSDMDSAKENLWNQLNAICSEIDVPKTPSGIYKNLVILGGTMSCSDFFRLLECDKTGVSAASASTSAQQGNTLRLTLTQDAKEDLSKWSPFFSSFEETQRCTIWVQSDFDKGRIDGTNRLVNEATPNSPKKIYFGCDPKVVASLWNLMEIRAKEVGRGVKYLYLGPDRIYQPLLMQNHGKFFEFVKSVTGASVSVDSMTGDHLRIDGASQPVDLQCSMSLSEGEKAALAVELIRLQIELYRDHCIRQKSWMFGRDWALERRCALASAKNDAVEASGALSPTSLSGRTQIALSNSFDNRALGNACFEIVDIVAALDLSREVSAHAVIIMYRFITILSQPQSPETQIKIRDLIVVCIFIANKARKASKWKKLDAILEASYSVFYPGSQFDSTNKESKVWEERIIFAEGEVLERLEYDVTIRGFQWMVAAAKGSAGLEKVLVKDVLSFAFSGAVLAAGPDLWLAYGEQYVFAASAAFMNAGLEAIVTGLKLIPIKIFQAAELIASSVKVTGFGKKHVTSHPLCKGGKKALQESLCRIKTFCANLMSHRLDFALPNISERDQRYRIIRDRSQERRTYLGIQRAFINDLILPVIDGIAAGSLCCIYIDRNQQGEVYDITLIGSWKAISIASHLLKEAARGECELGRPVEKRNEVGNDRGSIQAKGQPGVLRMNRIENGWSDTIQSEIPSQTAWNRKTGGRCCVPGKVKETDLRVGGLRWWIPPRYGPSSSGSICDMFLDKSESTIHALGNLSFASQGETADFSMLTASAVRKHANNGNPDRFVAVSLHRWPSEKVAAREQERNKNNEAGKRKKPPKCAMEVGFSPGALQELQLLRQLHGLIDSPQGHPNVYLPIGVALPSKQDQLGKELSPQKDSLDLKSIDEDIFSLTRSSLENEAAARKEQKRKDMVNEPHLVFQPTPFILQRFVSKKKRMGGENGPELLSPKLFASWCFDLLSAVLHCHENCVILRFFQLDQIIVDHSGVAKLGSLYRSIVVSKNDLKMTNRKLLDIARHKEKDETSRRKDTQKGQLDESDDLLKDPYVSPEMLLGSPKYTKETDMWALGCMLSHLLLNKAVFPVKDRGRQSLLSAIYKIVGVPASRTDKFPTENFPLGVKFPYYIKPSKKYVPGVEKALTKMMKEIGGNDDYAGAIDLIGQMLHLDPEARLTAKGGLQHEYISSFLEESNNQAFQEKFAEEWMSLKQKLTASESSEIEVEERKRSFKRNALLMTMSASTSMNTDNDDLYDLGDMLGPPKKQKL